MVPIEYIDLSKDLREIPINSYQVGTGEYGVMDFDSSRPFLLTMNLAVCRAIIFYSPETKKALMSHTMHQPRPELFIDTLVGQVGDSLQSYHTYIVGGQIPRPTSDAKMAVLESLAEAIGSHEPEKIYIDDHCSNKSKAVLIDLNDGHVQQLTFPEGWKYEDYELIPFLPNIEPEFLIGRPDLREAYEDAQKYYRSLRAQRKAVAGPLTPPRSEHPMVKFITFWRSQRD
jgi:hypothetical protein